MRTLGELVPSGHPRRNRTFYYMHSPDFILALPSGYLAISKRNLNHVSTCQGTDGKVKRRGPCQVVRSSISRSVAVSNFPGGRRVGLSVHSVPGLNVSSGDCRSYVSPDPT